MSSPWVKTAAEGLVMVAASVGMAMEKGFELAQSSPAINDFMNHGRAEMASALFGHSDAHVQYLRTGQSENQIEVDHGLGNKGLEKVEEPKMENKGTGGM